LSDVLDTGQRSNSSFRPADNGSSEMAGGSCGATTWQNKFLEHRQVFIESVQVGLETINEFLFDCAVTGNTEFTAEFEQIVLHLGQALSDIPGQRVHSENETDCRIGLINRSVSLDSNGVLGDTTSITESRRSVIAGAGIYFA
jgi:hypothetical protein